MATMEHETDEPQQPHSARRDSSGKRHHRSRAHSEKKPPGPLRRFLGKFWFELVALTILSLGIFLLVERLEIKLLVYRALVQWVGMVARAASSAWVAISSVLTRLKGSNLVGIVFVAIALMMIAYSLRLRAIARHPDLPADKDCPRCHREIHRLPRRRMERVMELLLWIRIRRYGCSQCAFETSVWRSWRAAD